MVQAHFTGLASSKLRMCRQRWCTYADSMQRCLLLNGLTWRAACCLAALTSVAVAKAQSTSDLVLLVDQEKLVEAAHSTFRKALLAQSVEAGATESVEVKSGDTLNRIVSRVYGYADSASGPAPYRAVQSELVGSIAQLNPGQSSSLQPGQILKVPKFLRRSLTKGSSPSLAQVLNLSQATRESGASQGLTGRAVAYTVRQTQPSGFWTRPDVLLDDKVVSSSTERTAGTSLVRIDTGQLPALGGLDGLREKFRAGLVAFLPNTEQYVVTFGQGGGPSAPHVDTPSANGNAVLTAEQSKKLQEAGQGRLYLLDVFSTDPTSSCLHGDLVYEKAIQTLRALGADAAVARIEKRSIDFYSNRAQNTKFIREWIERSFRGKALENYRAALSTLEKTPAPSAVPTGQTIVPGLFLQYLYGSLASEEDALVVSGSFFTQAESNIFPKDILLTTRASLVNAVLNESSSVEAQTQVFKEPIATFNLYRELLGTVLVGYFDSQGTARGMYSERGIGVTTIDDGIVVGNQGMCKGRKESGASFAAPVVAAKLLVGRLLWPSTGTLKDAFAARDRLVRSSTVRRAYLDRYWSAGASLPARLYSDSGQYLTHPDGTRTAISNLIGKLVVNVTMKLPYGDASASFAFKADPQDPRQSFSSLVIDGGDVYLYSDRESRWRAVQVESICLCGDEKKNLSLSEAKALIREVATYE